MFNIFENWTLDSWRERPALQQPKYPDINEYNEIQSELSKKAAIVKIEEIESLKRQLSAAANGEGFVIQAGDCAERFSDANELHLTARMQLLSEMAKFFEERLGISRATIIGRMAGQYFKPRSQDGEWVDGVYICPYRGDGINGFDSLQKSRIPDPRRLLLAYESAKKSLSYIEKILTQKSLELASDSFFISHEALVLAYEQALVKRVDETERGLFYAGSAHMLWVGERTRTIDGAHIEFLRGLSNPIGVKIGPDAKIADLINLAQLLNPNQEPGKLVFITRLGREHVAQKLKPLLSEMIKTSFPLVWFVDPMHGNMRRLANGIKTRHYDDIKEEIFQSIQVFSELGQHLAGLHLEVTFENANECLGGPSEINESQLGSSYTSYCDPRLNYNQTLELVDYASQLIAQTNFKVQLLSGSMQIESSLIQ
ncbi:MAG: 3-deoxy-7-phosphoheptulonate synthase [Oligoflexales bacterium]|nr:3-deoxy-7-phosphoheptulonate synthase [Oligoflexales bacterium]